MLLAPAGAIVCVVPLGSALLTPTLTDVSCRVMGFVNKLISRLGTDEQLDSLTVQLCQRHLDYGALPRHMTVSMYSRIYFTAASNSPGSQTI